MNNTTATLESPVSEVGNNSTTGAHGPNSPSSGLTLKSFLITLCLIPINIYWIIELEVVRPNYPTIIHPQSNVIFIVFWLLLIGYVLNKISPALRISQRELLTIYFMLCIVSCLCSWDMMEILVPIMSYAFRFATPENEWREMFWKHLPQWLTVQDEKALIGYYEGDSSLYTSRHLKAWLIPTVAWSSFIFVLMVMLLCINTLLRVQWTEHERLTYPLTQLPLQMTNPRFSFLKNRLMWFGFGLAALISTINLLNSITPTVPYIPVKRMGVGGGIRLSFYPFVIGLSFLIPLDLLFSCWVFFWFYKIELMIGGMLGWRSLPRFPYAAEQGFGVYLGLLGFALWTGRIHFIRIVRHVFTSSRAASRLNDTREPMPYRLAFAGIVAGMAFLTIFSYKAGMALWVVPIFFGIYFLLAIVITRLRAELGFLVHGHGYRPGIDPHSMIVTGFGTRRLGSSTLAVFSMYMFFNRANWVNPMPEQLEAFKMSERRNINQRHTAIAILLATLIGSVMTFWLLLDSFYRHGHESGHFHDHSLWYGRMAYSQLENWLNYPQGTDGPALAFMGGGLVLTVLLMFLRTQFLWWSLHPLGYVTADSWGMLNLWSCIFVAWVIKAVLLRYGGLASYRRAVPFFLGVALGDYIVGSIWGILGILTDTPLYHFFP